MTIQSSRVFGIPRPVLLMVVMGVFFFASVGLVPADERITFKNGRTLVVKSVREEGDMLFVTLNEGGEIGFPKSLIEGYSQSATSASGPINHNYAGRGKTFLEMASAKLAAQGIEPSQTMKMKGSMAKDEKGRTATAGFSFKGTKDAAGADTTGSARTGINLLDFVNQRRGKTKGKPAGTTVQPATPAK